MRALIFLVTIALPVALLSAQTRQARTTLDIYVVDVEGGNGTLFVAPSGESLLIDTGNGGAGAVRDAERILAATKDAGLTQIDHLVTTHYHGDHYGGMFELAKRVPIRHFIDHGPNIQAGPNTAEFDKLYPELYATAKHTVVKPGDRIAVTGIDARVVTSNGQAIAQPLAGAGRPNPFCAGYTPSSMDMGENAMSVGTHITFGRFRTVMLGDLTSNKEVELMCPNDRLGTVDLFLVSHHGMVASNSPPLVHALAPRAAVMNNGTRKGGQPDAMRALFTSPGLEDLWLAHFSELSGQEFTPAGVFIANMIDDQPAAMPIAPFVPPARAGGPGQAAQPAVPAPAAGGPPAQPGQGPPTAGARAGGAPGGGAPVHNGTAYWIKISASQDGSFTVTNARNGFTRTYRARP